MFLAALCLMVMVLAILIARARIIRRQTRRCGKRKCYDIATGEGLFSKNA